MENAKENRYQITREISIDMAHRVHLHGSKCKNIHGHRYRIVATCEGGFLVTSGEQSGMLMDFGFLKEIMVQNIHDKCDHALMICEHDPLFKVLKPTDGRKIKSVEIDQTIGQFTTILDTDFGTLVVVAFTPTAENLSKYWFRLMQSEVHSKSNGNVSLKNVTVWETPTCSATYPV